MQARPAARPSATLLAAVGNNAEWCAAFCRASGVTGTGSRRGAVWCADGLAPELYPELVTLRPEVSAADVGRLAPLPGSAVKDSFQDVDLAAEGSGSCSRRPGSACAARTSAPTPAGHAAARARPTSWPPGWRTAGPTSRCPSACWTARSSAPSWYGGGTGGSGSDRLHDGRVRRCQQPVRARGSGPGLVDAHPPPPGGPAHPRRRWLRARLRPGC